METKHEMPALTDSEREELIAEIEYNRENCFLSSKTKLLMQIAEAALTLDPYVYRDSLGCFVTPRKGQKLLSKGEMATPLYSAPTVPVLKLPNELIWSHQDNVTQAEVLAWNSCLAETKRLNGMIK